MAWREAVKGHRALGGGLCVSTAVIYAHVIQDGSRYKIPEWASRPAILAGGIGNA